MGEYWDAFKAYISSMFDALFIMLGDVALDLLDSLMGFINTLLVGLSFGLEFLDLTNYISGLPVEVTQIMGLIGVTQASTMIVTSLGIRIILQLIPFTRLGS